MKLRTMVVEICSGNDPFNRSSMMGRVHVEDVKRQSECFHVEEYDQRNTNFPLHAHEAAFASLFKSKPLARPLLQCNFFQGLRVLEPYSI